MAKVILSPEELTTIQKCINDNVEIPLEIIQKLNPSFFDKLAMDSKFNFERLNKYKIPTIEYAGKRSESTILASATLLGQSSPLQVERLFKGGKIKTNGDLQLELYSDKNNDGNIDITEDKNWMNMIIQGDNLQFLKTCYLNQDPLIKDKVKGKVKLIYIDPPFGTGDEYGAKDGTISYSAKLEGSEYLEALRERLIYLREIIATDGSIFVRIDYRFGHYIKLIIDEVFGKQNFRNQIIVSKSNRIKNKGNKFLSWHDMLFYYAKNNQSIFFNHFTKTRGTIEWRQMDNEGEQWEEIPQGILHLYSKNNIIYINDKPTSRAKIILGKEFLPPVGRRFPSQETIINLEKMNCIRLNKNQNPQMLKPDEIPLTDNWTDISGYSSTTNYPTENSEDVLERVLMSSTLPGDLVIDCFGGSGTTAAVAEKLGRRWIMCDFGKHSIYTMQKRILTIEESKKLGKDAKKDQKYEQKPKPFCIASVGAFDFSKIMDLRKHKEAYIAFVLELNGINERDVENFKMPNIYATKEGNPVEVFPIWNDEYLKNIKIDKDYLQGIIKSSGGKLKGDYYIVAPETCDVIGDTSLSNQVGSKVNFKLLTFPYKILEEVSRHYQLSEQPSSSGDINNLISSTKFYFNEEVSIKVELHKDGLLIKDFVTDITDENGNKYMNIDGLAMVLIDKNWDGNLFTMEEAVYLKDIANKPAEPDYGVIKISGLNEKIALIAIDKHGNESKIVIIEK